MTHSHPEHPHLTWTDNVNQTLTDIDAFWLLEFLLANGAYPHIVPQEHDLCEVSLQLKGRKAYVLVPTHFHGNFQVETTAEGEWEFVLTKHGKGALLSIKE